MGLVNNHFRIYFDGIVEGSAHALLTGQWDSYRQFEKFIYPDMGTVLTTAANPPGYYIPCCFHPPITAGELSWRPQGEGNLSGYMYPALLMSIDIVGVGTMTMDISGRKNAFIDMTGDGDLSAGIAALGNILLAATGNGDLEAALLGALAMSVDMTGSGDLTGAAVLAAVMGLAMSGNGDLAANIAGRIEAAIDMEGSGGLDADIEGRWDMEASLTGSGDLDAGIQALANMLIEMTGTGDLDAAINAVANMSVDIVVTGAGLSTGTIASAVWSALAASNADAGSMGEQLTAAKSNSDIIPALF